MTPARRRRAPRSTASRELAELRARLSEAEETLRAIGAGEVDAVVVDGAAGPQVFTLEGAEHRYRMLIESMNEGALTLTTDKAILYANRCFARMVKCPLEQVIGSSLRRFLSPQDRTALKTLVRRTARSGAKVQVTLHAADGSQTPAQVSIRPLAKGNGERRATVGVVVTDLSEARRNEELLRALTHRVVEVQEAERGRVALELHDHITQLLCAVLFRSQALADGLSAREAPAKKEAMKLREMLGHAAEEVERISRGLRPSVLDQLGLIDALRRAAREFADQTGVSVKVACAESAVRLPADTELALYRVLQEALKNVERHAGARHVSVGLTRPDGLVQLTVVDDGVGFDPDRRSAARNGKPGLGLLGMGERAAYVGGTLSVESAPGRGTTVRAQVPVGAGRSASGVRRRKAPPTSRGGG